MSIPAVEQAVPAVVATTNDENNETPNAMQGEKDAK
jgi:hypothetical protein